jgi:hypothetical protein
VQHEVDAAHRALDRVHLAHVAPHELDAPERVLEILLATGGEVIEHADRVSAAKQLVHEVAADEPCPAGHQILGHSLPSLRGARAAFTA